MRKNWLSYLASGATVAILVLMVTNANAETIVSYHSSENFKVDKPLVTLNLMSSSLNINPQQQPTLPNLGCTCAACQKISTQTPL